MLSWLATRRATYTINQYTNRSLVARALSRLVCRWGHSVRPYQYHTQAELGSTSLSQTSPPASPPQTSRSGARHLLE